MRARAALRNTETEMHGHATNGKPDKEPELLLETVIES